MRGGRKKKETERGIFLEKNLLKIYLIAGLKNYTISFLFLEQKFSFLFKATTKKLSLGKVCSVGCYQFCLYIIIQISVVVMEICFNGKNNSLREGLNNHMLIAINFNFFMKQSLSGG